MARLTDHEKLRQYLNLEKIRHRHDALFFNELRRFFREELILLLALPEFTLTRILATLDARQQRLQFLLSPLYANCANEFYTNEISQKSIMKVYDISHTTIADRCGKIIANTKEHIQQAFSRPEMAKEKITAFYSTNNRAMRIAKTEVNTASNLGMYQAALANGREYKLWICSREDGVRDGHRILENEKVLIREAYSNGLVFPGDPNGTAGQVINCRCFQIFV